MSGTKGIHWFEACNDAPTAQVFTQLGLEATRGARAFPCVACGGVHADGRGAMFIVADGSGWACRRCEARGGNLDAASYRLAGARYLDLTEDQKGDVRAWFAAHGWCEPDPRSTGGPKADDR